MEKKYRKELNDSLTGRESMISSIVTQNGEINTPAPQINSNINNSARQLKIKDILSVDKAQLSKMSITELKEFAARAAKLNAESMGVSGKSLDNYIAQSTADNEPAALIKNIEGIKGDLGIELKNLVLQDSGNGGKMGTIDDNLNEANGSFEKNVKNIAESKPLKIWLSDVPELLNEIKQWYNEKPEWWSIDPENTDVFYRTKDEVDAIRKLPGESGGHHPHGLALGGPIGQTLTPTGETARIKNPTHSQVTGLQKRIINKIKGQKE